MEAPRAVDIVHLQDIPQQGSPIERIRQGAGSFVDWISSGTRDACKPIQQMVRRNGPVAFADGAR
jgi:hypothetical protein